MLLWCLYTCRADDLGGEDVAQAAVRFSYTSYYRTKQPFKESFSSAALAMLIFTRFLSHFKLQVELSVLPTNRNFSLHVFRNL